MHHQMYLSEMLFSHEKGGVSVRSGSAAAPTKRNASAGSETACTPAYKLSREKILENSNVTGD